MERKMRYLISIIILSTSIANAAPTSTVTSTQNGEGKIGNFVRLHSWHHFHVRNDTAARKLFKLGMTLCPVGKNDECVIQFFDVGLDPRQEYDYDNHLYRDVIYRTTGEKSVVASSSINGVTLSSDQKYTWIHY
jgi:hypothetical protein